MKGVKKEEILEKAQVARENMGQKLRFAKGAGEGEWSVRGSQ